MQQPVMKDVLDASAALMQASASVKQLAQCRRAARYDASFMLQFLANSVIVSQERRMGPFKRASHDCAGLARAHHAQRLFYHNLWLKITFIYDIHVVAQTASAHRSSAAISGSEAMAITSKVPRLILFSPTICTLHLWPVCLT